MTLLVFALKLQPDRVSPKKPSEQYILMPPWKVKTPLNLIPQWLHGYIHVLFFLQQQESFWGGCYFQLPSLFYKCEISLVIYLGDLPFKYWPHLTPLKFFKINPNYIALYSKLCIQKNSLQSENSFKSCLEKEILERPDIDNWKDRRVNKKVVVL